MGLVPIVVNPGQTHYVVPVELMNHINATQYQEIVNAVIVSREKGCNYACMVEWGVCLVTCIWCVFFCHACIENAMVESELLNKVNFLNNGLFQGQRVLSTQNCVIYVNTDMCHVAVQPQVMTVQMQPGVQPVVQVVQPVTHNGMVQAVDANGQLMYTQDASGQVVPVYLQQSQHHHHGQPAVAYAVDSGTYATTVSPMAGKHE